MFFGHHSSCSTWVVTFSFRIKESTIKASMLGRRFGVLLCFGGLLFGLIIFQEITHLRRRPRDNCKDFCLVHPRDGVIHQVTMFTVRAYFNVYFRYKRLFNGVNGILFCQIVVVQRFGGNVLYIIFGFFGSLVLFMCQKGSRGGCGRGGCNKSRHHVRRQLHFRSMGPRRHVGCHHYGCGQWCKRSVTHHVSRGYFGPVFRGACLAVWPEPFLMAVGSRDPTSSDFLQDHIVFAIDILSSVGLSLSRDLSVVVSHKAALPRFSVDDYGVLGSFFMDSIFLPLGPVITSLELDVTPPYSVASIIPRGRCIQHVATYAFTIEALGSGNLSVGSSPPVLATVAVFVLSLTRRVGVVNAFRGLHVSPRRWGPLGCNESVSEDVDYNTGSAAYSIVFLGSAAGSTSWSRLREYSLEILTVALSSSVVDVFYVISPSCMFWRRCSGLSVWGGGQHNVERCCPVLHQGRQLGCVDLLSYHQEEETRQCQNPCIDQWQYRHY